MNRKILYIIFTALAILLLVTLLWWWFLRRETESVQTTGTFGTAQNAAQGGAAQSGGVGGPTNVGSTLPQTGAEAQPNAAATQTNIQLGGEPQSTPTATQNGQVIQGQPVGQPAQGQGSQPVGISGTPNIGGGGYGGAYIPGGAVGNIGVPGVVWLYQDPGATVIPFTPGIFTPDTIVTATIPYIGATTTSVTVYNPTTGTTVTAQSAGNAVGTVFNPTAINQVAGSNPTGNAGPSGNVGFNPYGQQVTGSGGSSALSGVAMAAGAGLVSCAVVPALQLAAAELFGAKEAATVAAAVAPGTAAGAASAALSVSTIDIGVNTKLTLGIPGLGKAIGGTTGVTNAQGIVDNFMGCMTRNIAKIMLQQITASVVNWINSGFNGSPAFVQNPTQFLQRTADVAAGQYIQSSALSFLCSPFQLQIRIAIAQSYANRNAASCTLTQVSNNINNFMRGSFTAGGWPAFLSFTTMPTNNPYGAFIYASAGLSGAVNTARGQVQTDLLQGQGFLSFQQRKNCRNVDTPPAASPNVSVSEIIPADNSGGLKALYSVCDWVTATPGRVIADALGATQQSSLDQLGLAKSFDEIIGALINQLMTRTLQGGLSNLSGAGGYASNFYTTGQIQAQNQAQGFLTQMQSDTAIAAQYGAVQQGSIEDIQNAQSQLNDLANCWNALATASTTPQAAAQAVSRAAAASTTLAAFEANIAAYNNRITLANQAIVFLEQTQTKILSSMSSGDISDGTSQYNAAKASGSIPTQADVTNAQQNRATLQTQLGTRNQQTQAELAQCRNAS